MIGLTLNFPDNTIIYLAVDSFVLKVQERRLSYHIDGSPGDVELVTCVIAQQLQQGEQRDFMLQNLRLDYTAEMLVNRLGELGYSWLREAEEDDLYQQEHGSQFALNDRIDPNDFTDDL